MKTCGKCGKEADLYPVGDKDLCRDCVEKAGAAPLHCPNCGNTINELDYVGFALTPQSAKRVPELDVHIQAVICPACKIVFLDQFQYDVLLGLKRHQQQEMDDAFTPDDE
jgi:Zn-finger nucleic acid-binding protein